MAATGENGKVREAVAVFDDVSSLETAVDELHAAGFAEDAISLLAAHDAIARKLGHLYRRVEELEDDPRAPRTAFVSARNLGERESRVLGSLTVLPTVIAAGTVVASAGALAAVVVGTAVAGATLGTALSHFMNKRRAEWLQEQLERGGLLLWVRTATPERERRAVEVLTRHAVHDVHVHEIPAPA
jgi:outer membrane lipoprotein SlyB